MRIASVVAGGRRAGAGGTRYAHPSAMVRPATGRHHGAHPMPHPRALAHAIAGQVAWPARRASAA
eukprot:6344508-Prymnesium_polylepis.1